MKQVQNIDLNGLSKLINKQSYDFFEWRLQLIVTRFAKKEKGRFYKFQSIEETKSWGKSVEVLELLESYKGDRDQLIRVLIGRVFGGKVNQLPFESLVEQLSNRQLRRLKNKRFAMEAYLFGQAGLLSQTREHDGYIQNLQKEYDFLQQLFDQTDPIDKGWKYSRMRPSGFPDIRIAQFASLLHHLDELPKPTHPSFTAQKFKKWAQFEISTYWQTRYRLGGAQQNKAQKQLSKGFIDLLLINAIVPYLYAIGLLEGKMEYRDKAIALLKELPPEKNRMMRQWTKLNQPIESAFHSQAYLALIKQGCNQKKCLLCNIGKEVLNL